MVEEKQSKRQKNNGMWFLLIGFLLILVFNGTIYPKLIEHAMTETDYGKFVSMVEQGQVKSVVMEDGYVFFQAHVDGQDKNFKTGMVDDPGLVERLVAAKSPNKDGKIEFRTVVPKENSPLLNFLLLWVLPGVIFYLIYRSYMGRQMGGGKGNFMSFGQNDVKVYADKDINTTFADVAGQDEAKDALTEIVDFLHNPQKYAEIGASMPKGALLVGPPGTGKTLIARAVAGEAGVPFFSMSGSEFVQMFVGMGASKVRDLFKQANEKAPCIVFIDEIDAIGKRRDNGGFGGNDEREQTLNQLLTEMDGFDARKGVVILAATNRPETLDKALLRPGRFDRRIPMELPDLAGRRAILEVHLKKIKHQDVNLDVVAHATAGSSGAEMANIVNEAALRAVRMGRKYVTTEDLEESVEVVLAGAQKKGKVVNEHERKIVAYHEVGHALVAALQSHSAPVHKITIVPRTSGALGYTMQVESEETLLMSRAEMLSKICTLTGGRAAEEEIFDVVTTGASNDIEQATRLARAMVTRYGMSDQYDMMALETVNNAYLGGDSSLACASETAAKIDQEVLTMIKSAHEQARQMIRDNRQLMDEAAGVLLEKETITGEEFMAIFNKYIKNDEKMLESGR